MENIGKDLKGFKKAKGKELYSTDGKPERYRYRHGTVKHKGKKSRERLGFRGSKVVEAKFTPLKKNITASQKKAFIKSEKKAIAGYEKAGLHKLASGEKEDLKTVQKIKPEK